MTHSHVWRVSFIWVPCLIYVCDRHIHSFTLVKWLIVCDATHSYECYASFMCVTDAFIHCLAVGMNIWVVSHAWISHVTYMHKPRHSYIRYDAFYMTWLFHVCDMTPSCVLHDWFITSHTCISHVINMNQSRHEHERVMSHRMRHILYMNEPRHPHTHGKYILHNWVMLPKHISTYDWVMSPTQRSQATHTSESCHTPSRGAIIARNITIRGVWVTSEVCGWRITIRGVWVTGGVTYHRDISLRSNCHLSDNKSAQIVIFLTPSIILLCVSVLYPLFLSLYVFVASRHLCQHLFFCFFARMRALAFSPRTLSS